jgi:hypothetical protein
MSTTLAKQFEGFADCCLELARSAKTTARRARFMQMAREYHLRPGNADHNGGTNWPSDSVNLANSARSMRPELASIIFAIGLLIGFLLGYGVRAFISYRRRQASRRRPALSDLKRPSGGLPNDGRHFHRTTGPPDGARAGRWGPFLWGPKAQGDPLKVRRGRQWDP